MTSITKKYTHLGAIIQALNVLSKFPIGERPTIKIRFNKEVKDQITRKKIRKLDAAKILKLNYKANGEIASVEIDKVGSIKKRAVVIWPIDIKSLEIKIDKSDSERISLSGKSFIFTGRLDSMLRNEAESKVRDSGGRIVHTVTARLDYLVLGSRPGTKLKKARNFSTIKIIKEQEFIDMLSRG